MSRLSSYPLPCSRPFFYYCCRFLLLMVVVGDGSWYDDDDGRIYLLSPCFKSLFLLFKTEWTKKWKSNTCLHDDSWMLENDLNWFWLCTTGDRESERDSLSRQFFSPWYFYVKKMKIGKHMIRKHQEIRK